MNFLPQSGRFLSAHHWLVLIYPMTFCSLVTLRIDLSVTPFPRYPELMNRWLAQSSSFISRAILALIPVLRPILLLVIGERFGIWRGGWSRGTLSSFRIESWART